ncbi:MAG TPA: hypothetical protein VK395_29195 [Gemmataceae bacterium]|nr:hypothetical protein [Gemmataceae bacterium]
MTQTYQFQARCVRSFTACIEIEADTPDEVLANARLEHSELIATAQDSESWPWDEFTVCDQSGNTLLHVRDEEARLRDTAPRLLEVLERAVNAQVKHVLRHSDGMVQDLTPEWVQQAQHLIAIVRGKVR